MRIQRITKKLEFKYRRVNFIATLLVKMHTEPFLILSFMRWWTKKYLKNDFQINIDYANFMSKLPSMKGIQNCSIEGSHSHFCIELSRKWTWNLCLCCYSYEGTFPFTKGYDSNSENASSTFENLFQNPLEPN